MTSKILVPANICKICWFFCHIIEMCCIVFSCASFSPPVAHIQFGICSFTFSGVCGRPNSLLTWLKISALAVGLYTSIFMWSFFGASVGPKVPFYFPGKVGVFWFLGWSGVIEFFNSEAGKNANTHTHTHTHTLLNEWVSQVRLFKKKKIGQKSAGNKQKMIFFEKNTVRHKKLNEWLMKNSWDKKTLVFFSTCPEKKNSFSILVCEWPLNFSREKIQNDTFGRRLC